MIVDDDERLARIVVEGDLDWVGGDELKATVGPLVRPDVRLRLDLRGVDLVDSSGLAALLVLSKKACAAGGTVVLCDPSPRLLAMLERTNTMRLFSLLTDH